MPSNNAFERPLDSIGGRVSPTVAVDIARASKGQRATVAAFLEGYLAEFGYLEPYPYFEDYWSDPLRHPFLIYQHDKCAGFALVRSIEGEDTREMAEFYVVPEFRGSGVGRAAVAAVLSMFPGRWNIPVQSSNRPGLAFWSRVLGTDVPRLEHGGIVVFAYVSEAQAP